MSIDGGTIMSKEWSDSELLAHVESAIENFNKFLHSLLETATEKGKKRASLIGYWINEYTDYQKGQDTFNPRSLPRYERGSIIEIHFGYRVGSELGGRHYGVVLDRKNDWSSPTITVAPLTSLKGNYNKSRFTVLLLKGLYELVHEKATAQITKTTDELIDLRTKREEAKVKFDSSAKTQNDIDSYKLELDSFDKSITQSQQHINSLRKTIDSLKKMKKGSVLEVGQIVTISKQRISNPKMISDSLWGIKLGEKDMQALDTQLNSLFMASPISCK